MPNFNGTLGSNKIYAGMFNMIISQQVFADNIVGTYGALADMCRVDGSMYGDRKLYYATDALATHDWLNDAEAANLLALDRAPAPKCQEIVMDIFRQIRLTTDDYLTKQAWMGEGAFSSFNSVMLGWMRDTKRIYDSTLINTFIGTNETTVGGQQVTIALPAEDATNDDVNTEAYNRLTAQAVATKVADLMVELTDVSRDFNDYGYVRSYDKGDLVAIWNSEAANKIRHNDLPTIFHKDDATAEKFEEKVLPARYFGTVITSGGTSTGSQRTLVEKDYTGTAGKKHCFPGDLIPAGAQYAANEAYNEDATILFKIMHKDSVPFMSAFEVGTSFFNARSLTTNHYLTYGHNTIEHLMNYPFITVRGVKAGN